eukprot:m.359335 g.359335  ORF g.359335 m.359335 type:complete len:329 (-) comp18537_c0_seq1:584-1570(-)
MDQFVIERHLGSGAHGVVFKAKHIPSGERVALKKVVLKRLEDGIPNALLREIQALQELNHVNVITLRARFGFGLSIVLAFDYMISDLSKVMAAYGATLPEGHIKRYMTMLLKGIHYCHSRRIIHRDLKPANLLLSPEGILKIADFGLARVWHSDDRPMSHEVATRWYRAPELLFGARHYDIGVDLWAIACIFAELLNNSPLFAGESDIDQLTCVLEALGTPTPESWPELSSFPDFEKVCFEHRDPKPIKELVPDACDAAVDLLSKVLVLRSDDRLRSNQMLLHPYFFEAPLPVHHSELHLATTLQSRGGLRPLSLELPQISSKAVPWS